MTPQEAKALAEVMLAYAEGRQIQIKLNPESEWEDINNPSFRAFSEYRVKPETKTGWINIYESGTGIKTGCVHDTKEIAVGERNTTRECIACIEIHYTPGEGL